MAYAEGNNGGASKLGVQTGDLLMVHASLKAIGPVEGGAETSLPLRSAVGPTGTVMGYASWDRSPYEETLNYARLDDEARRAPAAVRSRNSRDLPWVRPAESISGSSPGARRSAP